MNGNNVIPPITHPLGSGWDQPDTSLIEIDDEYALMPQETFDALGEYSASRPTGVYEGKMWKRYDGAFDQEFLARGGKPVSEKPDHVSNHRRKIIIV